MTVHDAILAAHHAARAGHPAAVRRRNELLAYAASRGARIRTLAALTGSSLETMHRWTGGVRLEREQILTDQAPPHLRFGLDAPPIPGQQEIPA